MAFNRNMASTPPYANIASPPPRVTINVRPKNSRKSPLLSMKKIYYYSLTIYYCQPFSQRIIQKPLTKFYSGFYIVNKITRRHILNLMFKMITAISSASTVRLRTIKVNLQWPRLMNLNLCLQILRFTKSFVSRKLIKIISICKMILKQNITSYISIQETLQIFYS